MNNTSTVVGDGSSDKYEKKILEFFGREYKLWGEYRSMLNTLSKATMSQNTKLQTDQLAELLSLVRSHQSDRLKNLTSLSNYSKKSSGFFGSGFGSGKTAATMRGWYGIKEGPAGTGVQAHPGIFSLINKVVTRHKSEQSQIAALAPTAAATATAPPSAASKIDPALVSAALRAPRSRASVLLASNHRVSATPVGCAHPSREGECARTLEEELSVDQACERVL